MSIFDNTGSRLSAAFAAIGCRLDCIYSLDGRILWGEVAFAGPQTPWSG